MNRGIKQKLRSSIILSCTLCMLSQLGYAGSVGRAIVDDSGSVKAPTKEDSAAYFSNSRQGVSKEDAKKADELRGKTIDQIKALLTKQKGKNEFELLIRLGELYIERSDFQRDQELDFYVFQYEKWKNTDAKTRGKQPQISYKASESQIHLAINAFRKLVTSYPKHPRTDAALYSLAGALSRTNDDNALLYYKQLIKQFPKSPLVPDAWLAMGEYYFDKHQIPEATKAYQSVMEYKTHRAYAFAVYKLGWCYYNSQGVKETNPGDNLRKSISAFKLVVKLAETNKDKKNFNLRDEAIRDLVMAFAETEDTDAAWKYFKTIGEEAKFYVMLERLGNTYADAGKNDKAIEVFTRLVTEAPTKANNPKIYQKLVELYDTTNRQAKSVETIKAMHLLYAVKSSPWIIAQKEKQDVITDASKLTERTTHRYGTMFHSRGQKTKNKQIEAYAAEIYTQYLDSFSSAEPAYEIRYYLADIQMAQGKYEASSDNYMKVAKQKPKDGRYLKESALMSVTAIARLNEQSKFAPLPPAGQVPKPLEVHKAKQLYVSVIDQYIALLPNEKDGHAMRYTAAQIYFDYGHYDVAIKRFDGIATGFPSTKQGQTSARVVVAYFNEKSDWSQVITYGKKYQADKQIMADASVKKFIEDSLRAALFNSAMGFEKAKEHEKAALAFLEFRKMFPQDSNADKAVYNASLNFFKGGRIEDALAQQKQLLQDYPRSTLAPDVTASMGETYEALAQFQNAADTYRKFAQTWPTEKRSPNALYNAAVLYRGVKQLELSATVFYDLYRRYPNNELANDALFESARIRESRGDITGAVTAYKEFVGHGSNKNTDNGLYAQAKIIELQVQKNPKDDTARRDLNKLSTTLRAKNSIPAFEARRVVASTLFQLQEPQQASFKSMPLSGDGIEKQAKAKQTKLEQLAAAYEEVIAIGNAEFAVASLYRLGEMHEEFSKALFNATPPSNSSQAEANAFKSQLEKVAFPLKTEAYKFFETAYKRSQEVESFSHWTTKTYQKMVELAPEKHKELNEQSASPGYLSYKVSLTKATEDLAK